MPDQDPQLFPSMNGANSILDTVNFSRSGLQQDIEILGESCGFRSPRGAN